MWRNSGDSNESVNAPTDTRQYPTRLHGKIIHIAMGLIAAALGAIAIPSILKKIFLPLRFLR